MKVHLKCIYLKYVYNKFIILYVYKCDKMLNKFKKIKLMVSVYWTNSYYVLDTY